MNERIEKRSMGLKASRALSNTIIYILLIIMSVIWLIPFVCIVLQSFRVESTWQVGYGSQLQLSAQRQKREMEIKTEEGLSF